MHHIRIRCLLLSTLFTACAFAQTEGSDPAALAQHAIQLQQSGNYAAAADAYRALLQIQPNQVATHVNLGIVLVHLGRYDEAIAEYEAANKLLPDDPRIALNLALAYEKSGRVMEAVKRFEKLHAAVPSDNKITMLLADCHLQLGDDDQVVLLLRPLERQKPDDLGLAYMLGMALLRTHRIQEGQVLLDRILRNGDTAEARFLLGARMFASGDYPAAVKQLASAIDLNPSLPGLQSLYGQALLITGDPDAAAGAFRKELAVNANDYPAHLELGQILVVRRQFADALPVLRRASMLRPGSSQAQLALAQCLNGLGRYSEARLYAEEATKAQPSSVEAHQTLSSTYAGLHLSADAARERKAAGSLNAVAENAMPGPKLNEAAPDFDLPMVASGKMVRLSEFRGKTPLVLVFGSYSCPNFRSSADALKTMYQRYGSRVPFLLVYIREAHADGNWQSTRNIRDRVALDNAGTINEKKEHAAMCSRKLHLPFPAVVDGMDGAVETAYNAWPSRAFVVSKDGRIVYSTRLTELDFHPEQMESVLRKQFPNQTASTKKGDR